MNEPEQPSRPDGSSGQLSGYSAEIEMSDEAMGDLIAILKSGEDIDDILEILQPAQWEIDRFRLALHQIWDGPEARQFLSLAERWIRRSKQERTTSEDQFNAGTRSVHTPLEKAHLNVGVIGADGAGKTTLTSALTKFFGRFQPFDEITQRSQPSTGGIVPLSMVHVEYQSASRRYTHFDFPEHSDTVKAIILGAARLDGAILVVSADEGPTLQAREHILLAREMGVETIVVFLNKTDRIQDFELVELIELEIRELLQSYGYPDDLPIIKGSALEALTDTEPEVSERPIRELVDCLDTTVPLPDRNVDAPFLLQVADVRTDPAREGVLASGYVERGRLRVGDTIEIVGFAPASTATCAAIEVSGKRVVEARAGETIELELAKTGADAIQWGQVLCQPGSVVLHKKFRAEAYFLTASEGGRHTPFFARYRPQFSLHGAVTDGEIELAEGIEMVMPGDTAVINVELTKPVAIEEQTRFFIREGDRIVGTGVITSAGGSPSQRGISH